MAVEGRRLREEELGAELLCRCVTYKQLAVRAACRTFAVRRTKGGMACLLLSEDDVLKRAVSVKNPLLTRAI